MSEKSYMVAVGAMCGVGLGLAIAQYADMLLCKVRATDSDMLVETLLTIPCSAAIAAAAPVTRAVRIEPMAVLKVE